MRVKKLISPVFVMTAAMAAAGCQDKESKAAQTFASKLTYSSHIAPILNEKCVKCHQAGGIGPFRLDNYDDVKARSATIARVTSTGIMPPYLITHDGTCGQFEDAETLTSEQMATISAWAAGDLAEGTPIALTPPRKPSIDGAREFKTPTLAPVPQGGVLAQYDEYRCFAVDYAPDHDAFITGYDVLPGNPAIVHHVLVSLVDPNKVTASGKTNADVMAALDQSDPDRIGWPCFSPAGEGVEVDAIPTVWAPGQGPVYYPQGIGVRHRTTDKVVVQVHYNLSDLTLKGQTDSTAVRLRYADSVDRRAVFLLSDGFLATLGNPRPDVLLPGLPSVKYRWARTFAQMMQGAGLSPPPYVDVVAIMPHMHQRGHKEEVDFIDGTTQTCAAKVEDWNFHWQKFYFYKDVPPRLTPSSVIQVTCDYDTSEDNRPVLPGWGTRNEMCLPVLMVALPPGM